MRMTRSLVSRGPDAVGIVIRNNVAFAHRRLKIIDLSNRGQQPMEDPELGLCLAFNGCIYNYREIREKLRELGYRFFSDSDTEVILKAYHAWGEACVERFNGMFAFVIHERDSGRTFLARDRLGIKPLYFLKTSSALRFASTLPALLAGAAGSPDIDPVALHHYMTFHSVVPAPLTIFKGYSKLAPATTRTIDANSGHERERIYWRVDYGGEDAIEGSEQEIADQVLDQLRASVQRRMEADVPVGVLLSGGVDSSLVVGLLSEMGVRDLKTFSIGFSDQPEEGGNEFRYSDIIAAKFGTEHHRISVSEEEMLRQLPECISAMSEPMVSHDNIGFFLLGKHVSEHVKVVQSGQGADELFAGYHWYQALQSNRDPVSAYADEFFDRDHEEFSQAVAPALLDADYSREFVTRSFETPGADDPVDKALRLDTGVMLVDDPVKRVDNMTMAWGLEARVPFLDHELVEFTAAVPSRLKVRDGGKYILKQAARKVIPDEVIDRPKGYFPVPTLKYLRGSVLEYVREALHSRRARDRGLWRQEYMEKLLADPARHLTPLGGSKLWQLATLELWLQAHTA